MDYKNRDIALGRIGVTTGWAGFNPLGNVAPGRMDQNLCGRLWTCHDRAAVRLSVSSTAGTIVQPTGELLRSLSYKPAAIGDKFGPTWASFVFKLEITVPPQFRGAEVHLLWDSNSEALVMNADGAPRQGLVGGNHHCRRADYSLFSSADGGDAVTLFVEASCNGLFGAGRGGDIEPPDPEKYYALEECCVAVFDRAAWDLIHDLTCLEGLAKDMPEGPQREHALQAANLAINAVVIDDRSTYAAARACAAEFFAAVSGPRAPVVHSILHSHIDLAWLWPASATPAKAARTFSTQLRLVEEYPEMTFVQSQAQLWEWCKLRYPVLFEEMKAQARAGRFIPVGGTWVEMDTNLPSGEALIRQFLVGQTWFEDNLGVRCDTMWLPDTFGYASQLPQIMQGCGVRYFMTNKLAWNNWNKPINSTYVWEGLDGSGVLVHMPPAETYNAQAFPEEVVRSVNENKDSGVLNQSMMLIGHGDGGGGASPAMVESLRRLRDVEGLGKAVPSNVGKFFAEAEKVRARLPKVVGELYFELHRGTFTSQAKIKRLNRECESRLGVVEALAVQAMLFAPLKGKTFCYPREELTRAWKLVLTNAFHDTLPGTCIRAAYDEAEADYAQVLALCDAMQQRALDVIFSGSVINGEGSGASSPAKKRLRTADGGCGQREASSSAGSFITRSVGLRQEGQGTKRNPVVVEVPAACTSLNGGVVQASAISKDSVLLALRSSPDGVGVLCTPEVVTGGERADVLTDVCVVTCQVQGGTEWVLANGFVQARIASSGRLKSLVVYSKCDREAIEAPSKQSVADGYSGMGNELLLCDDVPLFWDAWDVEVYAGSKTEAIKPAQSVSIVEEGPLRATLVVVYPRTRGGSEIRQYISLSAASSRLDFRTTVDWRESRKLLRAGFRTTVRAPVASFGTQFGFVQRPTHRNDRVSAAQFECVGHQFCDVSGYGLGVALLSDSKYGYSVLGGRMQISLLKSPKSPDATCDMGAHEFTYSLRPHLDAFPCRAVLDEAEALNWPPIALDAAPPAPAPARAADAGWLVRVVDGGGDGLDSVRLSAVKGLERGGCARGYDESRSFIVRLYESLGGSGAAYVEVCGGLRVAGAAACANMLEEEEAGGGGAGGGGARVSRAGNVVRVDAVAAFEIVTLRVTVG